MVIGKLWNKKELLLWLWNHLRPSYAKSRELINEKTHDIQTWDRHRIWHTQIALQLNTFCILPSKKSSKQIPHKTSQKINLYRQGFYRRKMHKEQLQNRTKLVGGFTPFKKMCSSKWENLSQFSRWTCKICWNYRPEIFPSPFFTP